MKHLLRRLFSLREADSRGIAISLHDDIGQDLALIGLRLSILKKSLSLNKLPDIPTALSELQELILVTHKKTRELECAIYPRVAEISLDTAMNALVELIHRGGNIAISFLSSLTHPPTTVQALCIYRTSEEILNALCRRDRPVSVEMALCSDSHMITLSIIEASREGELEGLLPLDELLEARIETHGGHISVRTNQIMIQLPTDSPQIPL